MNGFKKILQRIYFVYACLLFLILMIPAALITLIVAPLGPIRGGNLIYKACGIWADIWFPLVGIFTSKTGYKVPEKGAEFVYVANHISWLDAAVVVQTFRHPMRPLGKAEVGKIPIFGFIYRKAVVMVDRSNPEARHKSVLRLKSVLRKGVSILVFPEGTFNETHLPLAPFYDGAFRIAIETGTPIKPVLLLDTYERMPYESNFSLNPGRSRVVFLDEIPVLGLKNEDIPALRDKTHRLMSEALINAQASWITLKSTANI